MRVRFAFFNYNKKKVNAIISIWTWLFNPKTPHVSHVEQGFLLGGEWRYFSSTTRGNDKGTRWISAKGLFRHPERWEIIEIEVEHTNEMISRANSIVGLPYDWLGISGFATPFGLLNKKLAWYCSEACYFVLSGKWKKRISPRRLYSYINKKYANKLRRVSNA